jgi:hypothetical protein
MGSFESAPEREINSDKSVAHKRVAEHPLSVQADIASIQGPPGTSFKGGPEADRDRYDFKPGERGASDKREPPSVDFAMDDPFAGHNNRSTRPDVEQGGPERLVDRIKKIEEQMVLDAVPYIQQHGTDAEKEMVDSVKKNKVTFLGEIHTVGEPNPHREMVAKALKEMPPGSILTAELPDALKPVFDKFNASKPGSDFEIPDKLDGAYGKEALDLLRKVKEFTPDLIDMWKAAHDRGIKVEPIDSDADLRPNSDPQKAVQLAQRDQHMKDDIMKMINDNPDAHIIVEGGNMHAAHPASQDDGRPLTTAQLLLADPDFQKQGGTLKSFYSEIASMTASNTTMFAATFGVHTPLAIDTKDGGSANKVGPIPVFEDPLLNSIAGGKMSDFDEVIVYPFEQRQFPKAPAK